MSRPLLVAGCATLVAAFAPAAAAHPVHGDHPDDMIALPSVLPLDRGDGGPRGVTLYLNGGGARLTGGWDDSARDVSSIAMRAGGDLEVPAWAGGARRWDRVVACVRDLFAEFAVDVVTDRPERGDYIMIVVGGDPSLVGFARGVSGVAPYSGEVLRRAVGYVFSANLREDVEQTCVAIAHETGHALGLDHSYDCADPMSYLWGCGAKRFRDADAYCGEGEARACGDGALVQNSWRHLAAAVGLRDGAAEPAAAPPRDAPPDRPWRGEDAGPADPFDTADPHDGEPVAERPRRRDRRRGRDRARAAPSVVIDGRDGELDGNGWIELVVRASAGAGIAEVELAWASEDAQYVLPCGRIPDEVPVRCRRDGDTFVYHLLVGTGLRAAVAVATDGDGNQAVSEPRVLWLAGDGG